MLDALNDAAVRGNGELFFSCFTEDAVVFWLDPASRWTRDEFAARLRPLFGAGERFHLVAKERNLSALPGERAVAFDETISSHGLGRCRAQGVLVERDGRWLVHRYGLDCATQPLLPPTAP